MSDILKLCELDRDGALLKPTNWLLAVKLFTSEAAIFPHITLILVSDSCFCFLYCYIVSTNIVNPYIWHELWWFCWWSESQCKYIGLGNFLIVWDSNIYSVVQLWPLHRLVVFFLSWNAKNINILEYRKYLGLRYWIKRDIINVSTVKSNFRFTCSFSYMSSIVKSIVLLREV